MAEIQKVVTAVGCMDRLQFARLVVVVNQVDFVPLGLDQPVIALLVLDLDQEAIAPLEFGLAEAALVAGVVVLEVGVAAVKIVALVEVPAVQVAVLAALAKNFVGLKRCLVEAVVLAAYLGHQAIAETAVQVD